MTSTLLRALAATPLLALAASPVSSAGHAAPTMGFALADNGMTLVVMPDIAAPDQAMTHSLSTPLQAIDYRPMTGALIAMGNGALYQVDPMTGTLTDLGATIVGDAAIANGASVDLDFNNQIDAVRAVSSSGDNLVYFPQGFGDNDERAGSLRRFTALAYGADDANAGTVPMVFANAYSNAINGMKASATQQYTLDAATDSLARLANNQGTLSTVGPITLDGVALDLAPLGGFDILSATEGEDTAYAILQLEGATTAGLYTIDLTSGAASLSAELGMAGITGFAVAKGM